MDEAGFLFRAAGVQGFAGAARWRFWFTGSYWF
jgi:hypothetical protein